MADDLAKRREIRRRKILEGSDERLKRITSSTSKNNSDVCNEIDPETILLETPKEDSSNLKCVNESEENALQFYPIEEQNDSDSPSVYSRNPPESCASSNGSFSRSTNYYEFPKKVSDAETRSLGRTRSDIRRNSSCTQIMMETLQSSSFFSMFLRFLVTVITAFGLKVYFLIFSLSVFETIFIPFLLLEIGFFSWTKYDPQVNSRPAVSSLISGILLLYGSSSTTISRLQSVLNAIQIVSVDFCIFVFSFVFCHFVFETYV